MNKQYLILLVILIIGAFFRLYGINWDQGQHLHPDERFITMVVSTITWPQNISEYLDPGTSPLNPANNQFTFFVYGTFPIFTVKLIADVLKAGDYGPVLYVGRFISAFVDLLTIILVYKIARILTHNLKLPLFPRFPLIATFLYTAAVLPIQLSHFFAVDTFLVFFTTLALLLLLKITFSETLTSRLIIYFVMLGLAVGLGISSKITAVFVIPFISMVWTFLLIKKRWNEAILMALIVAMVSFFSLRITSPYMFANSNIFSIELNPLFLENMKSLKSMDTPTSQFPPAVQWRTAKHIVFPAQSIFFYGFGIIPTILALGGFVMFTQIIVKKMTRLPSHINQTTVVAFGILLSFAVLFFLYQGVQYTKNMRYFIPLYPILAISGGYFLAELYEQASKERKRIVNKATVTILCLILLWPVAFMNLYTTHHSRVLASEWIYDNIKAGASIGCEHWDDCLPLSLPDDENGVRANARYQFVSFDLYDPESEPAWVTQKEGKVTDSLNRSDYIVLTSNRLYGSIPSAPNEFPYGTEYYRRLFNGELGFTKVGEFTVRPTLKIPGISICLQFPDQGYGKIAKESKCIADGIAIVDDYSEESFTVYDHPKVIIFKKNASTGDDVENSERHD